MCKLYCELQVKLKSEKIMKKYVRAQMRHRTLDACFLSREEQGFFSRGFFQGVFFKGVFSRGSFQGGLFERSRKVSIGLFEK
jgi:hypothetical protein